MELEASSDRKLNLVARFPQIIRRVSDLYGSIQGLRVVRENQTEGGAHNGQNELDF